MTDVKTIIAGKEYKGLVIGIRQDVECMRYLDDEDYNTIPKRFFCEITFGSNTVEVEINEKQFGILAENFGKGD